MKNILKLCLLLLISTDIYAQIDVTIGMGLDFNNVSSYRDYVNENFAPPDNQVSTFKSSVMFFGEADFQLYDKFQAGVEYNLLLDSYNTPVGAGGIYEISYILHRPTIICYYVLSGEGYKFKFGGGVGPRFAVLNEKIYYSSSYSSAGIGFLLKAEGHTALSSNFFAVIGIDLRYDLAGEPSNRNGKIYNNVSNENMNLNSLSVGLKLGISFTL